MHEHLLFGRVPAPCEPRYDAIMTHESRTLPASDEAAAMVIADHLDHFFRTVVAPDDALNSSACIRYITGEPHPLGNLALFSRAATAADVVRDAGVLRDGAFPSAIVFLDDGTHEQLAAASDLGFSPAESMPLMSVTPDTLASTALPDEYSFREVRANEADAWARTVSAGYGLPLLVGSLFGIDRAATRCPGIARRTAAVALTRGTTGMGELAAVAVVVEEAPSVAACREVATLGQRLAAIPPDALEAPEMRLVFAVIDDRVFAAALLATRGLVQPLVDVGFPASVAGIAAARAEDE